MIEIQQKANLAYQATIANNRMTTIEIAGQDYADAESFQRRIVALRKLSGEQRLTLAFEMWRTACQITRDGIRSQFPDYSAAQVNQELARRIMISNGSARIISTHYQNSRPG